MSKRCVKCIINGGFVGVLSGEIALTAVSSGIRDGASALAAAADLATDIYKHAHAFGVDGMTAAAEPWNGCSHATILLGWLRAPESIPPDAAQIMAQWREEILDDLHAFVSGGGPEH